jgi:hypothetical protein
MVGFIEVWALKKHALDQELRTTWVWEASWIAEGACCGSKGSGMQEEEGPRGSRGRHRI